MQSTQVISFFFELNDLTRGLPVGMMGGISSVNIAICPHDSTDNDSHFFLWAFSLLKRKKEKNKKKTASILLEL